MYGAERTRTEILLNMSQLPSRIEAPVKSDQTNLITTKGATVHLSSGGQIQISASIDASFCVREDRQSHTSVVLQVASVGSAVWTANQKDVTKSSE